MKFRIFAFSVFFVCIGLSAKWYRLQNPTDLETLKVVCAFSRNEPKAMSACNTVLSSENLSIADQVSTLKARSSRFVKSKDFDSAIADIDRILIATPKDAAALERKAFLKEKLTLKALPARNDLDN